jgi:hypothetical protein
VKPPDATAIVSARTIVRQTVHYIVRRALQVMPAVCSMRENNRGHEWASRGLLGVGDQMCVQNFAGNLDVVAGGGSVWNVPDLVKGIQ